MFDADKTGELTFRDLSFRLKLLHSFRAIRSAVRRKRISAVAGRHLAEMRRVYRVEPTPFGWSCNFEVKP